MTDARRLRIERRDMTTPSSLETGPAPAEAMKERLLKSLRDGDYAAFSAVGTERFQEGITRAIFQRVSDQVAARLKAGFSTEFLTELHQCEHGVYLWKLSFRDGQSEFIARLALTTDGKAAGFMLN